MLHVGSWCKPLIFVHFNVTKRNYFPANKAHMTLMTID